MTTTATSAAVLDARVFALRTLHAAKGATWKFCATEVLGAEWTGANMDGGRALRAYKRAVKAGVVAEDVKLPKTLMDKLAKGQAAKTAKATPAKKAEPTKAAPKKAAPARRQPTGNGKAPAIKRVAKPVAQKPEFTVTGIPVNEAAVAQAQAKASA